jgi:hypothetical protein
MRLRFSLVTEEVLEECLKHKCVTLSRDWFATWQSEDRICLVVAEGVAALGYASGEPGPTDPALIALGLHPYQIPVEFTQGFSISRRPSIRGRFWKILEDEWGETADWAFGHLGLLEGDAAAAVITFLDRYPKELNRSTDESPAPAPVAPPVRPSLAEANPPSRDATIGRNDSQGRPISGEHAQVEACLRELATITGCELRCPKADGSALEGLANRGVTGLREMDAIWVREDQAVAAFTFFSDEPVELALLRTADAIIASDEMPAPLYVIVPADARADVAAALSRPTFRSLNLGPRIRLISSDDVRELLDRTEDLAGHLSPSVLQTIASAAGEAA